MTKGLCRYCEDPLPEGMTEGYCDDVCKDLDGRILKGKGGRKINRVKPKLDEPGKAESAT